MSFTFALHKVNESFDQIAEWYRVFMERTEKSFRALHERLTYLENRQAWQAPTDEQVERVVRKILAEKFADAGFERIETPNGPNGSKEDTFFVQKPARDECIPNPIQINTDMLHIDPDSVPSEAYRKQFKELESDLDDYPHTDLRGPVPQEEEEEDSKPSMLGKPQSQSTNNSQYRTKPWS